MLGLRLLQIQRIGHIESYTSVVVRVRFCAERDRMTFSRWLRWRNAKLDCAFAAAEWCFLFRNVWREQADLPSDRRQYYQFIVVSFRIHLRRRDEWRPDARAVV